MICLRLLQFAAGDIHTDFSQFVTPRDTVAQDSDALPGLRKSYGDSTQDLVSQLQMVHKI